MMSIDTPREIRQPITTEQRNDLKKLIMRCLCDEFPYGKKKINKPIFDRAVGYAVYAGTDLKMVAEKIVLGLSFGMDTGVSDE